MKYYAFIQASLIFNDESKLNEAISILKDGEWLLDDGTMVLEDDEPADELWDEDEYGELKIIDGLKLTIPPGLYYGLNMFVGALTELAHSGTCTEESDDGEFYIFVWMDGEFLEAVDTDVSNYCRQEKHKELFTLDFDDYSEKYPIEEEDYYVERADQLTEARFNMEVTLSSKKK